ncbi:Methylthioribulose-1-phosphate dehydratase [bacterium HR21]|nr:Methylthioribulose-1-phosphate dehydratase [bacterium HR21]
MSIPEGVLKFQLDWEQAPLPRTPQLEELCSWRAVLFRHGLIGAGADGVGYGNVSIRSGAGARFLITGTGTGPLPELTPEHCTEVLDADLERNRVRCRGPVRPSSESLTHAALYLCSPEIGAVVHVHDSQLWHRLLNKAPTTAPTIPYGTPELAADIQRLVHSHRLLPSGLIVMGGHPDGLLSFGTTLPEAVTLLLQLRLQLGLTALEPGC